MFGVDSRNRMLAIVMNFIPLIRKLPLPRNIQMARCRKSIVHHATNLVREKEAKNTIGKDILSLMIQENRKAAEEGKLAEMEMVDQVMTFMLAGHETTSTAVPLDCSSNLVILDNVGPSTTSRYPNQTSRRSQTSKQSNL
jgi:cytochrome P450